MELSIGDVIKDELRVARSSTAGLAPYYVCDEFHLGFPTQALDDEEIAHRGERRSTGDAKFALKSVSAAALSSGGREQLERKALICATVPPHPNIVERRSRWIA
jgi:hypothetical protein